MSRILVWMKRAAAALGAGGLVVVALGLVFAAGELREGARAACSAPGAGWLTRGLCRVFSVEVRTPVAPIELPDTPEVEDVDREIIPDCKPGQGLERLVPRSDDLVEWERTFGRDLDGNGRVGTVSSRGTRAAAAPATSGAGTSGSPGAAPVSGPPGEPVEPLASAEVAAIDRLIFGRKEIPPSPRGGQVLASTAASGGPLVLDYAAVGAPKKEWLHELELAGELELPVGDDAFADSAEFSAEWTFARWRAVYLGLRGYVERPGNESRTALGRELDWGVRARLSMRCRGLGDCEPR